MKIKYIALCLLLALVGCQREEDMEIVNATINNERIDPSYSSVSISCNINCNATVNQVKAYISTTPDFSNAQTQLLAEQKKGTYAAKINGLANNTTYYVCYKISNNYSSFILDKTSQFKTIPYTTPTVQTNEVTDVTYNSAIVGGTIKENGGQEIKECGIVYSKSPNPTIENGTKVESNITKEAYTCTLTNLDFAATYYARAYAVNEKGIAYGEEISFKTNGTTASLDTLSISGVTATSAVISGALINDGGESITALGVCYGVNQSPTLEDAIVVNAELDGLKFSVLLNNLQKGTTYYVRAYATNSHGTVYSDELYFNTEMTIPAVTTAPATDISYTSATVGGNVTDNGGANVTERGICYSTSDNPTTANTKISSGSGLGEFMCNLTDLQDGTTYYVRAYAINAKGTSYGEEVSFTTKAKTTATITTKSATNVSYTSATVGGNVTDNGGATVTERGICYSRSANPTTANTKITSGSGLGQFTCNLTDLQDGTTYYVRAYAINEKGTAYGEEVSFTTKQLFTPTIVTTQPTNVAYNSATVGGNVTNDGGASVTERGICYSTSANPTTANTKITSGSGLGEFTCNLTDLQDGTTYYVRAYAVNAKGIAYGEEVNFTTKTKTIATVVTTPATNVSYTSATIGGDVTDDGGAEVAERGVVYSISQNPTTSNTKVTKGSGIGLYTCNLTDLQDGTTYYVRAYAINSKGTAYGEEVSFTTKQQFTPTIVTNEPKYITYTSATVGGNVTDDGGASITERGVVYATTQNPTTANTKITSGSGLGQFTCNLTNLQDATTYYARAYAINEKGIAYGEGVSFTTKTKTIATVVTTPATNVSYTSATVGGNVTDDGGANITERGIVYSTSQNPTIVDSKVTNGSGLGEFTCDLIDLQEGTTYYARAYAINEKGIAYGEEVSFTTKERYYENGYEYIDLGLSVKWATCNVGASSSDDYGDYFAWGETEPKDNYSWNTYKWCNGDYHYLTKYNTHSNYGTVDNKTQLELSDDVAVVNWGGNWRMPTDAELTELRELCTWTWTSQNGVKGYNVTSKINGNIIFLPAAGGRIDSSLYYAGNYGYYWSSSLYTDNPDGAYGVRFNSIGMSKGNYNRLSGFTVRPVCP